MGRSLAAEIEMHLQNKDNEEDLQISFICHSLGGLIVRSALAYLERWKLHMNTFISLSCPHMGYLYHGNHLTKLGMMAISKVMHLRVMDTLLLKDNGQSGALRNSYIYGLSMHQGLSWFKSVSLYGSEDDGYVSVKSALIEDKEGLSG